MWWEKREEREQGEYEKEEEEEEEEDQEKEKEGESNWRVWWRREQRSRRQARGFIQQPTPPSSWVVGHLQKISISANTDCTKYCSAVTL